MLKVSITSFLIATSFSTNAISQQVGKWMLPQQSSASFVILDQAGLANKVTFTVLYRVCRKARPGVAIANVIVTAYCDISGALGVGEPSGSAKGSQPSCNKVSLLPDACIDIPSQGAIVLRRDSVDGTDADAGTYSLLLAR